MCIYIRKFIDTFAHGTKKEGASFCSRDGDKRKTFSFIAHAKRLKGKRVDFSQKKKRVTSHEGTLPIGRLTRTTKLQNIYTVRGLGIFFQSRKKAGLILRKTATT